MTHRKLALTIYVPDESVEREPDIQDQCQQLCGKSLNILMWARYIDKKFLIASNDPNEDNSASSFNQLKMNTS